MEYILLFFVMLVAFFNGANDVSKGVATLHGSGLTSFRGALRLGTLWTVVGGMSALFIASGLLKVFSSGIVSADATLTGAFSIAVASGVVLWLLFASRLGLPVSTTHALVGSICGAAIIAFGPAMVLWGSLWHKIIIPLLLSPFIALAITFLIHKRGTSLFSYLSKYCLCFELRKRTYCVGYKGSAILSAGDIAMPSAKADSVEKCVENSISPVRFDFNDIIHWASSALICFARGLNDIPKIVALLAASAVFFNGNKISLFLMAALAMGLGSYLKGLKVTETLSKKVTTMDRSDSVIANLSTAALVVAASNMGLPVSTTYVSSSSIIGIGLKRVPGSINKGVVGQMLLAWVVTLPVAGIVSAAVYLILRNFIL